jgi:hypothetical protein
MATPSVTLTTAAHLQDLPVHGVPTGRGGWGGAAASGDSTCVVCHITAKCSQAQPVSYSTLFTSFLPLDNLPSPEMQHAVCQ